MRWSSYTVAVRPNSADLVIRDRDGDSLVLWDGGTVVADRTACAVAVRSALAPVDEAFGLPKLFSQIGELRGWPADPNGEPLRPGRQPYI